MASCAEMFAALKEDALQSVPARKRSRSNSFLAKALFMTTSQKNLGDICGLTPDVLAQCFEDTSAIDDILAPAKAAKERFMLEHESNPVIGKYTFEPLVRHASQKLKTLHRRS
jgi:hypothetical protein